MTKIYILLFAFIYSFNFSQQLDAELYEINYQLGLDSRNLIKFNDQLIFAGAETNESAGNQNFELWGYNFSTKKTSLIKELIPYANTPFSGNPQFTRFQNKVYFIAEMSNNNELWMTDGTTSGTKKIFSFPEKFQMDMTVNDSKLLITSNKKAFISDGTTEGTRLLKEFVGQVMEGKAFAFGSKFIFAAKNANYSNELWITDGENETIQIINTGDNAPLGVHTDLEFHNLNGTLLFYAQSTTSNEKGLYSLDPVTKKGKFIFQTNGVSSGQILNNKLIFKGWEQPLGGNLYATDGTAQNTVRLSDTNNFVVSLSNQNHLQKVGNYIYFFTNTSDVNRLWKTDGTVAGTIATNTSIPATSRPDIIKYFPENDVMMIENGTHNLFWLVDASENVSSLGENALYEGIEVDQKIIFPYTNSKYGRELFQYDFATNNTSIFKDSKHQLGSTPQNIKNLNGNSLIFSAFNYEYGNQFYTIKNKGEIPKLVKAFSYSEGQIVEGDLFKVGGYFYVKPKSYTGSLAKTNGAEANTKILKMPSNNMMDQSSIFINLNDESLIFSTINTEDLRKIRLWKNDKNSDDIELIKDITTGESVATSKPVLYNGYAYFTVRTKDNKYEIWKTDGTSTGTGPDFQIPNDQTLDLNANILIVYNDRLLINKNGKLWSYNSLNNELLEVPFPEENSGFGGWNISENPEVIDGKLYVLTQYGYGSIYRFDDLQSPPVKILSDNGMAHFSAFKKCGNQIYFGTGNFENKHSALWSINSATTISNKIFDNGFNSEGADLTCINNYLYFLRGNSTEIFRTNGIPSSTISIPTNITNEDPILPTDKLLTLLEFKNSLYFVAKTQTSGEELYIVNTELPVFLSTNESGSNAQLMKLILYPNPASSFIKIKVNKSQEVETYQIFDMTGKQILRGRYKEENQSIDISKLTTGNYIIEITTENGNRFSQKFIKK